MMPAQLSASFQSLPLLPTCKLCLSGADSPVGGLVYLPGSCGSLQWALLWGWEFLPLPQPPQVFTARGFEALFFPCWNPGLCGLSCSPVVPPSLSAHGCGTAPTPSHHLAHPSSPAAALLQVFSTQLPISASPTSLDRCFFSNSLVVRLPCSLITWNFWLSFVFKFVVFLLVVGGGKVYLPMPPSWWEVLLAKYLKAHTFILSHG